MVKKQEKGMTSSQAVRNFFGKRYEAKAKIQCNTCNVGTWVINREQHLYETRNEREFFLVSFIKSMWAKNAKTATPQNVTKTDAISSPATCKECKILILCKGRTFSKDVMDYAIDMASRTRSSLVALNLDEVGANFSKFRTEAKNNVTAFSCKATEAGLNFAHVVEQGTEDLVVERLHSQDETFRYVMNDVVSTTTPKQPIPVYSRAMLRVK